MRHKTTPKKPKARYKVTNWTEYNKALMARGNILFWLTEENLKNWYHKQQKDEKKSGRPRIYSDSTIELLLTICQAHEVSLRQAVGMVKRLFAALGIDLQLPHYSVLSRRAGKLQIELEHQQSKARALNIIFDSTGSKISGEGEWLVRKHGQSKRRVWRKLHIVIDAESRRILRCMLTKLDVHDAHMAEEFICSLAKEGYTIETVRGDGAYDTHALHFVCQQHNIKTIIPPRKGAVLTCEKFSKSPHVHTQRDHIIEAVRAQGMDEWKEKSQYHLRSLVESMFSVLKRLFGGSLRSRLEENQIVEAMLRCKITNKFMEFGRPITVRVA